MLYGAQGLGTSDAVKFWKTSAKVGRGLEIELIRDLEDNYGFIVVILKTNKLRKQSAQSN